MCAALQLLSPRVLWAQPASLVLPPLAPGAAMPTGCPLLVPSVSSGCCGAAPPTPHAARGVGSEAAPHQAAEPTSNQLGICRAMGSLAGGCHPRLHLGFLRGSWPAWAVLWKRGLDRRGALRSGPDAGSRQVRASGWRAWSPAWSCPLTVLGFLLQPRCGSWGHRLGVTWALVLRTV